jgi:hypothetical protein
MKFHARVEAGEQGEYVAYCDAMGASATGLSPSNALDALRDEIRYRVELCPCTSVGDDWIELVCDD